MWLKHMQPAKELSRNLKGNMSFDNARTSRPSDLLLIRFFTTKTCND